MSAVQDSSEHSERARPARWSFRIATVGGIPIRVHATFVLLLAWIGYLGGSRGGWIWPAFILAVFFCVVLHELGHALTAQRYEIPTRDITLYPIGGLAMLEGRPTARQEFWIALAGPAVNLFIAAILYGVLSVMHGGFLTVSPFSPQGTFMEMVLGANLSLAIFNLLPAFPMDGGRILRAGLALRMPEVNATQIATIVGQTLAVGIGIAGLAFGLPMLLLVAFFVFLGAGQELSTSVTRSFLTGHKIADAMQVRYRTLPSGATMEVAAEALLAGSQQDFPVVFGEEVVGILTRNDIARGLAEDGADGYVAGNMQRDFKTAHPNLPLERGLEMFTRDDASPVIVMEEGQIVGMLTQENLSEFIMLEHARQQRRTTYGYLH